MSDAEIRALIEHNHLRLLDGTWSVHLCHAETGAIIVLGPHDVCGKSDRTFSHADVGKFAYDLVKGNLTKRRQ